MPVRGDFPHTLNLHPVGAVVPVRRPQRIIKGLSGERRSKERSPSLI